MKKKFLISTLVTIFSAWAILLVPSQSMANTKEEGQEDNSTPIKGLWSISSEPKYYFWRSNQGESGEQSVLPFTASLAMEDLQIGLRTAHLYGKRKSNLAGRTGSVSTQSDTSLSIKLYV